MKVCLITKYELKNKHIIEDVLKQTFPKCNIKITEKAIKPRKKEVVKARAEKPKAEDTFKKVKPKKIRFKKMKRIPYNVAEWRKDIQYRDELQLENIQEVVEYYKGIKDMEERRYY